MPVSLMLVGWFVAAQVFALHESRFPYEVAELSTAPCHFRIDMYHSLMNDRGDPFGGPGARHDDLLVAACRTCARGSRRGGIGEGGPVDAEVLRPERSGGEWRAVVAERVGEQAELCSVEHDSVGRPARVGGPGAPSRRPRRPTNRKGGDHGDWTSEARRQERSVSTSCIAISRRTLMRKTGSRLGGCCRR